MIMARNVYCVYFGSLLMSIYQTKHQNHCLCVSTNLRMSTVRYDTQVFEVKKNRSFPAGHQDTTFPKFNIRNYRKRFSSNINYAMGYESSLARAISVEMELGFFIAPINDMITH